MYKVDLIEYGHIDFVIMCNKCFEAISKLQPNMRAYKLSGQDTFKRCEVCGARRSTASHAGAPQKDV